MLIGVDVLYIPIYSFFSNILNSRTIALNIFYLVSYYFIILRINFIMYEKLVLYEKLMHIELNWFGVISQGIFQKKSVLFLIYKLWMWVSTPLVAMFQEKLGT